MVKRSGGRMVRKSRYMGRKARGRTVTVADLVKTIEIGSKVQLAPNSKFEDFPAPRYAGRVGVVKAKQGKAYVVQVKDGKSYKTLIASAVHLKETK